MYKITFFGDSAQLAENLFFNSNFKLKVIFCEKNKINPDLLTFSFLRNIPIRKVENNTEIIAAIDEFKLDFAIMFGFGIILDEETLNKIKVFNIHTGKLPNYRGRHPTYFATINGDKSIFFTLHEVTVKIDRGKIIAEEEMQYFFWQNEFDVRKFLLNANDKLMKSLILYLENKIKPLKNEGGSYFQRVSRTDKILKIEYPASKLLNIIRAQAPYGGGIFIYNDKEYLVSKAQIEIIDKKDKFEYKILVKNGKPNGIRIDNNYLLKFTHIKRYRIER